MKIRLSAIFFIAVMLFALCSCSGEKAPAECEVHDFYEETIVRNSTCSEEGVAARICKVCGAKETRTIPALSHSYSSWIKVKDATCVSDGTEERTCYNCGNKETRAVKLADGESGHSDNGKGYCSFCNERLTIDMKTVVGAPKKNMFGFCYYKNSADGIKVCWMAENLSGKTINYYTITVYFYNAVGDPAYSEFTGKSSKTVKYVGPVAPGKDLLIFGIVDYVPVCSKVVIGEITLEYSDGTQDTGWYGHYTTYNNRDIG